MNEHSVMAITGTSRGIGRYLAEYYTQKGFQVIGCSHEPSDFQAGNYLHFSLDVADETKVKAMFVEVLNQFGHVDALINNAGIASLNHCLLTPLKTLEDVYQTNVKGSYLFVREAAKLMQERGGRIVNLVTVAVPLNLEGQSVYASSKAALLSLTKIFAKELASCGITVNAVGPTPIMTDMIRRVPKEKIDALVDQQAIKRMGEMSDVSNVIDFFIRPESEFITGQVIYLGGVSG